MKTLKIAFLFLVCLSSCSRCYECYTLQDFNGDIDTVYQDFCTADGTELEDFEQDGYSCSPSSGF